MEVLLPYIGEPARPGIEDTPGRVLRAWKMHWGSGYASPPPQMKLFREEGVDYSQMVLVSGIDFFSSCEHHLAPFFGSVDIAYIPDQRRGVLGLSKFARVVEYFCRRLQVQERLNAQIADFIAEHVSCDVGVVIRATHMCMTSRGVQKPNAITTTSSLRGAFIAEPSTKDEFLRLTARKA
jgi:GTP cyclohydrolase I